MPTTTITGLASGIEWADTVDLLMQIKRQPLERLQNRQSEAENKKSAWISLQGKLETLQSVSKGIDTRNDLLTKSATSTDTTVLSVSANANAVSANHTIIINNLAQAEVEVHDGWTDLNSTAVKTGSGGHFDYRYVGDDYSVTVPSGTTLLGLVQLINSDVNNPGVSASTIDDGGGVDPVHLVISSIEPGLENTIEILDSTNLGATGTEFDSGTFTETKQAEDAEIRVDGFPPGSWITRSSNEIDDVIEGVTLYLKDVDATGIEISIMTDFSSIKQNIKEWVEAYNAVMTEIAAKTRYDSELEIMGVLMGDSQVFRVRDDLQSIASDEIPGVAENATFKNLASIGLKASAGSNLIINNSDLDDALEEDLEAVVDLFVFTNSSTSGALTYFARTEDTVGGEYEVVANYLANGRLNPNGTNTIGGYPATVEGGIYLVGQEGSPVEGLRIRFTNPGGGPGTATATIRIGTGAAIVTDNKVEKLTDSIDGLIKIVKDGYDDAIEQLQDQIDAMERRLEYVEEQYNRQFQAMETAVSQARNQSSWLSSLSS